LRDKGAFLLNLFYLLLSFESVSLLLFHCPWFSEFFPSFFFAHFL
jgi:hypothetical protein